ncbi:alpha/beta fold hydrolase [Microbacterium sp. Leaf320]|uniref:alpha/beta fold hydrolase n=1 Tax=Microbacterium sp. Leaf320 TaxID=1736334 RepID=UPI0006FAAA64|nr:alpha/beta hydrolase [Microbacterium sp. Leaf320]KQQ68963.1 alpha/beta hydrolase [Microbacterium sp. Leaf320]
MATFVLVHGAGDTGWSWHLVAAALRGSGHQVFAPDLPGDHEALTLDDYADAVVAAVDGLRGGIVVGHSFGGFTAPIVAERLSADALVMLAAMIPAPGESPDEWWRNTGFGAAADAQAVLDGGLTGSADSFVAFYHDVPRPLAEEAMRRERAHPSAAAMAAGWPLSSWPSVPTRVVVCTEDRFFPPDFLRDLARTRLGVVADEIRASHCVALSRPEALASILIGYANEVDPSGI